MRLVSYNILDGGEGRADPLGEVIEAARPDLVALIEADDAAVVERIARRLKMDFVVGKGRKHSVALLSRWTIVESINHAALNDGFTACLLEATVQPPTGDALPLGLVHLHAHAADADERARESQLGVVLDAFARHRQSGAPHLLCGDFNSNAPTQRVDFAQAHPTTRDEAKANGGDVPRRVVPAIEEAGYVDALRAFDPAYADAHGSFTTQHPQQRVDYIFGFNVPRERVAAAWIEHDRLAKYASDHFPIGIELR